MKTTTTPPPFTGSMGLIMPPWRVMVKEPVVRL